MSASNRQRTFVDEGRLSTPSLEQWAADQHGCAIIKFDETPPSAGSGHLNRSPKAAFERVNGAAL